MTKTATFRFRTRVAVPLLAALLHFMARAQTVTPTTPATSKPGTWFIATVQLPGGDRRWGGFLEAQVRTNALFGQFNYYEYKGGVSYDLAQNTTALLGAGRYNTFDFRDLEAGPLVAETRTWQQLTQSQNVARVKFEHRYRLEQRYFDEPFNGSRYRNRIRYRLNLLVPINKPQLEAGTWFFAAYNEIFLNNRLPHFERNRLYGGVGYQFDRHWVAQVGLLNQYDYSPGPLRTKNNVVFTLVYRLHRRSGTERERLPTQMD